MKIFSFVVTISISVLFSASLFAKSAAQEQWSSQLVLDIYSVNDFILRNYSNSAKSLKLGFLRQNKDGTWEPLGVKIDGRSVLGFTPIQLGPGEERKLLVEGEPLEITPGSGWLYAPDVIGRLFVTSDTGGPTVDVVKFLIRKDRSGGGLLDGDSTCRVVWYDPRNMEGTAGQTFYMNALWTSVYHLPVLITYGPYKVPRVVDIAVSVQFSDLPPPAGWNCTEVIWSPTITFQK